MLAALGAAALGGGAEAVPPNTDALAAAGLAPAATPAAIAPASLAASAAEATLRAPPGSAPFAAQLGAQLSTFVRNGVEHARLHLNPAEMGPVTVQIQLDGQQAQVHLAAEHPLTRQALEQSMPQLASSLREAGLTLSGGGVFEHPRQGRDGQGDDNPAAGGRAASGAPAVDAADVAAALAAAPMRRRGVVDLVA